MVVRLIMVVHQLGSAGAAFAGVVRTVFGDYHGAFMTAGCWLRRGGALARYRQPCPTAAGAVRSSVAARRRAGRVRAMLERKRASRSSSACAPLGEARRLDRTAPAAVGTVPIASESTARPKHSSPPSEGAVIVAEDGRTTPPPNAAPAEPSWWTP